MEHNFGGKRTTAAYAREFPSLHQKRSGRWYRIDVFAYGEGIHNGPECVRCGKAECEHCHPEFKTEECRPSAYRKSR